MYHLRVCLLCFVLIGISAESYLRTFVVAADSISINDLGEDEAEDTDLELDLKQDKDQVAGRLVALCVVLKTDLPLVLAKAEPLLFQAKTPYLEYVVPPPEV